MLLKLYVFLLLMVFGISAWRVNITNDENFYMKVGANQVVNCEILLDNGEDVLPQFTWHKDGVLLDESKLQTKGQMKKDLLVGSLQFVNATYDDSGNYTCFVTVGKAMKDFNVTLTFRKPATFVNVAQNQYGVKNTHSRIKCNFIGDDVTVDWSKDGNKITDTAKYTIQDNRQVLVIANFSEKDSGIYNCRWRQSGKMGEMNISVTEYKMPVVEYPTSRELAYKGGEAKLKCMFSGNPTPAIYWFKLNKLGHYLPVSSFGTNGSHTLILSNVTEKEAGTYKCEARSLFDNVSQLVELIAVLPPQVESIKAVQFIKGEDAMLICSFKGEGKLRGKLIYKDKVLEEENFPMTNVTQTWTLNFANVDYAQDGSYECEISNDAGFDSKFVTVNVEGVPAISYSTEDHFIWPPASISLKCNADSVPKASWNWYFAKGTPHANFSAVDVAKIGTSEDGGSTLNIKSSIAQDLGKYMCVAENKHGKVNKIITVASLVPPSTPSLQSEEPTTKTSLKFKDSNFEGKTSNVPEKYIVYYMEGKEDSVACCSNGTSLANCSGANQKNITSPDGHLWLYELNPGTKYVLQVIAENQAGRSLMTHCVAAATEGTSLWAIVGYILLGLLVLLLLISLLWCLYRMCCRRSNEKQKKEAESRGEQNPFVEETETEVVYESRVIRPGPSSALYQVNV